MMFKQILVITVCFSVTVMVTVTAVHMVYAQEETAPATPPPDNWGKLKKDVKILRREIRKVRRSVSRLKKDTKSLKGISQAVTELNAKLETQIKTVKALSGEVYRISSAYEKNIPEGRRNKESLVDLSADIQDNRQSIKDIQDELKILRAVQTDLGNQTSKAILGETETSQLQKIFNWKYWGPAAFGIALIALFI